MHAALLCSPQATIRHMALGLHEGCVAFTFRPFLVHMHNHICILLFKHQVIMGSRGCIHPARPLRPACELAQSRKITSLCLPCIPGDAGAHQASCCPHLFLLIQAPALAGHNYVGPLQQVHHGLHPTLQACSHQQPMENMAAWVRGTGRGPKGGFAQSEAEHQSESSIIESKVSSCQEHGLTDL